MKATGWIAAALLLAGCLLTGCSDPIKAPPTMRSDPLAGAYPEAVAIKGLHEAVVVGTPIVEPGTADTPMRVTVPVRSVVDRSLNVQYRYIFMDERGRPLRSNVGWSFEHIQPRVEVALDGTAIDPAARDWRLEARPAQ